VTLATRSRLAEWYRRNRERTATLFSLIDDRAFYDRPLPLRHPIAFYEGHVPAFSFITLCGRGLHEPSVDPALETVFERGIDPASLDEARRHNRAEWPSRAAVADFAAKCDERVERALESGRIDDPSVPSLVRAQAAYTILEHEQMHQETLMYIVHQLAYDRKRSIAGSHEDHAVPPRRYNSIAPGIATLGAEPDEIAFGWDNEFRRTQIPVEAFEISEYPVTNGEWLRFVADGGPTPEFWCERDGEWFLRGAFEEIALPRSWPVYVSHTQAEDYTKWTGTRLPTEAEYHRAAFGTPSGEERPFPWGDDRPAPEHGNFGFERFDPEPVDAHPLGTSAWGVADLVGNGWEWTSTPFAPLPGFAPMASYPRYSADFFDGKHYVMKGASPVTPAELVRRSFRNWFFGDYPYMYAKFRCVT
jgi:formylglycine-generating enzyme required for sulfatase activity